MAEPPARARLASPPARPELDFAKTMRWKDGIVGRLNSGVSALLKKAGVKIVEGWARFLDGKTVEVETEIGLQVIRAEQVVIATGSTAVDAAEPAVRGHGDLVHRGPGAQVAAAASSWSWAPAISGLSWAPPSPRWAPP